VLFNYLPDFFFAGFADFLEGFAEALAAFLPSVFLIPLAILFLLCFDVPNI
jgi:hypothetical protein